MKIENKKLSKLKVGDKILGSNNSPTTIEKVYETHIPKTMYELEMENGELVKASGNHLWYSENDDDRKNKKHYFKLAKYYFKHETIPDVDEMNPAYPMSIAIEKFAMTKKGKKFIKLVCESLGPSVATPEILFDGYMDLIDEKVIMCYSFNDTITFLNKLKEIVVDKKNNYFYFGKVRTTEELYRDSHLNVNIPTVDDITNCRE